MTYDLESLRRRARAILDAGGPDLRIRAAVEDDPTARARYAELVVAAERELGWCYEDEED